jgi:hypothetical protein
MSNTTLASLYEEIFGLLFIEQAVELLISIGEAPSSGFCLDTDYHEVLRDIPQTLQTNDGIVP